MQYPINDTNDRAEQQRISSALFAAIPERVYYHNLIIAIADMLQTCVRMSMRGKLKYAKPREYDQEADE